MRPMQQRAPGGATRLAMDVEIHAQQDERPEDHCEDRGPDQPKAVEVAKVVVRRRDEDAHDQVDEAEQVDAQQTHTLCPTLRPEGGNGGYVRSM